MLAAIRELKEKTLRRAGIARELVSFLRERKAYWLIPLILVLLAAAFLFFVASQPPVTPFIYTLF